MGGGLESRCVGCVYGANGAARRHPHRTHDLRSSSQDPPPIQKLGAEDHTLQLNV